VALHRVYGGRWYGTLARGAVVLAWFLVLLVAWQGSVMFLAIELAS
jgi:hypothetical protein